MNEVSNYQQAPSAAFLDHVDAHLRDSDRNRRSIVFSRLLREKAPRIGRCGEAEFARKRQVVEVDELTFQIPRVAIHPAGCEALLNGQEPRTILPAVAVTLRDLPV